MKKLTSHSQLNKLAKGALAIVLASTFTFSATRAFADETTSGGQDQYPTVDLQTGTTLDANPSVQTSQTEETPSLLPGDFFYFAKVAFEKIKLALTFDDKKEAQLLADYASERLVEAQALFASGDQDTAVKTINQALENMKNADQLVESLKSAETTDQTEEDSEQAALEDSKDNDQTSSNQVNDDSQTTKEVKNVDSNVAEVNDTMSQNIIALTAAMNKVKNPVAKAALQRNIEKSYAKLAKKIDKMNAHLAKKKLDGTPDTENQHAVTDENKSVSPDTVTTTAASGTEVTASQTVTASKEVTAATSAVKKTVSNTAEKAQTVKQAKQEGKQVQQKAKQQVEQKRKEVKSFVAEKTAEATHMQEGKGKKE